MVMGSNPYRPQSQQTIAATGQILATIKINCTGVSYVTQPRLMSSSTKTFATSSQQLFVMPKRTIMPTNLTPNRNDLKSTWREIKNILGKNMETESPILRKLSTVSTPILLTLVAH